MTSPLDAAQTGIRQVNTVPTGTDGIYQALGELEELVRMLGSFTEPVGTAIAGPPGIPRACGSRMSTKRIPPESLYRARATDQDHSCTIEVCDH